MLDKVPIELNRVLVERFDEWLLVQHYSHLTHSRYMRIARQFSEFLGNRSLTTTTHSDVQQYLGKCAKAGYTVHLLNIVLLGLRAFFDFLSLGGLMNWVPPRLVRLRRVNRNPAFLKRRDIRRLFAAARNIRERLVLEVLYGTGCRSCELSSMRIENIDFDEHRVKVRSKGPRHRFLMLTPRIMKFMRRYLAGRKSGYVLADGRPTQTVHAYRTPCGAWYTNYRLYDEEGKNIGGLTRRYIPAGVCNTQREAVKELRRRFKDDRIVRSVGTVPISIYGIRLLVHRIGVRAGLRVYPRMLRHSIATHLLDNGADLRTVSACLGHSRYRTTVEYIHLSQKRAQVEFERFHPMQ